MSAIRYYIENGDEIIWLTGAPDENERTRASSGMADRPQLTRNTQDVQGADWREQQFIDRGNQSYQRSFSCKRVFGSDFEREAYLARLAPSDGEDELHPWQGDVWVRIESGDQWQQRRLPDAVVALTGIEIEGEIGLRLDYRIKAPSIDATPDVGAYAWLSDAEGRPLFDFADLRLASAEHDD